MSYIELSDVLFRGQLQGATGTAKFKLTAQAINAVDTVNIAGNQVTYTYTFVLSGKAVTLNTTAYSVGITVPDSNTYVEIVAYAHLGGTVYVDGVARPNRNMRGVYSRFLPYVEVLPLSVGGHTISIVAGATGTSSGGYILCRYIRRTGLDN